MKRKYGIELLVSDRPFKRQKTEYHHDELTYLNKVNDYYHQTRYDQLEKICHLKEEIDGLRRIQNINEKTIQNLTGHNIVLSAQIKKMEDKILCLESDSIELRGIINELSNRQYVPLGARKNIDSSYIG